MKNLHYLDQLSEIKSIMENRTKFHSLSGISGILAGSYAIIGAVLAYRIILSSNSVMYHDVLDHEVTDVIVKLILLATIILSAAIMTGLYFSTKKAKSKSTTLWTPAAKKVLQNFLIPFITGAVFVIAMLWSGHLLVIAPASLIFYGLSLVMAANYTFSEVKSLGMFIILTGLVNLFVPGYGILFWAIGFGLLHIVYGIIMYIKYEK